MTFVNPSINISIGNYGEEYITSFHKYFVENESFYKSYASFYKCGFNEDGIYFNELDNQTDNFEVCTKNDIEKIEIQGFLDQNDCQFFLKNSIANSYNKLVNLVNHLGININFKIVNVNFIISSFEKDVYMLLNELIQHLNSLNNSGAISHVSVKLFVIVSKSQHLLNTEELIITYNNLNEIRAVQDRYNTVFHNVIFIDNLNTDTVFLNLNEASLGFVLNEFVIYLMTNHYKMIGNLYGSDYISLGLGTLIFDKKYFDIFFKNNIIDDLIKDQIEIENHSDMTTGYQNLRDDSLYSFLRDAINVDTLIINIKKAISNPGKKFNILEYKFLISTLLGRSDEFKFNPGFTNVDRISLYDLAFKILNGFNIVAGNRSIDILNHKKRLDRVGDLKLKLAQLQQVANDSPCEEIKLLDIEIEDIEQKIANLQLDTDETRELNNRILLLNKQVADILTKNNFKDRKEACGNIKIAELTDEISELETVNIQEREIITETISNFKENKIEQEILNFIKPGINNNINDLAGKQKEIEKQRENLFNRLFKPQLKKELDIIAGKLKEQYFKFNNIDTAHGASDNESKKLFTLIDELESVYALLLDAIQIIKVHKEKFNDEFNKTELLDYLYVKNVIDPVKLDIYYKNNRDNLLSYFNDILDNISGISRQDNSKAEKNQKFNDYLENKLSNTIEGIVDFNIVKYLIGGYESLCLFKQEEFNKIISDLLKISKPFFNADNSFNTNNSHILMLHNKVSNIDVDRLWTQMKPSFAATIPQLIDTNSTKKFSIIQIDIIKDFNDLVKFNESEKMYNEKNPNTL